MPNGPSRVYRSTPTGSLMLWIRPYRSLCIENGRDGHCENGGDGYRPLRSSPQSPSPQETRLGGFPKPLDGAPPSDRVANLAVFKLILRLHNLMAGFLGDDRHVLRGDSQTFD